MSLKPNGFDLHLITFNRWLDSHIPGALLKRVESTSPTQIKQGGPTLTPWKMRQIPRFFKKDSQNGNCLESTTNLKRPSPFDSNKTWMNFTNSLQVCPKNQLYMAAKWGPYNRRKTSWVIVDIFHPIDPGPSWKNRCRNKVPQIVKKIVFFGSDHLFNLSEFLKKWKAPTNWEKWAVSSDQKKTWDIPL